MKGFLWGIISITCVLFFYSAVHAGAQSYLKAGYINNLNGEECWYTQKTETNNAYFFGNGITQTVGIITFDDPSCMSGEELENVGIDILKRMINNVISRWYSHPDANFMTGAEELFAGSQLQERGKCMFSRTYPEFVGIAVDYVVADNAIQSMIHGNSLMGCKNP